MKICRLNQLSPTDYQRIVQRSAGLNAAIMPEIRDKMAKVKTGGDRVLLAKGQERFGVDNYQSVQVTAAEIAAAYQEVDAEFLRALKQMIKNITAVQSAQLTKRVDTIVESEIGVSVWREWRAIEKVGLYIPGGKAIYPSSVLMSAIPAQIAGCSEIIICTPPRDNGQVPAPTLVAADMIGITKIFKVSGAEAIAAMTYGTETIPAVYKIFGAGNSFVTAAKMVAMETISIDMPAGPSEVFIIADETANPAFIAADLLADGEHGEDSACVLITTSEKVAQETAVELEKQLATLATKNYAAASLEQYGLLTIAETLTEAIAFTNQYAPEHLEVMTADPLAVVAKIQNAGSVFVGDWTTKSSGDYATGANHVLPTGGMAKMYPPLGVDAYGKWMQVQQCTKAGLKRIAQTIQTVATIERLPAHARSCSIRFELPTKRLTNIKTTRKKTKNE